MATVNIPIEDDQLLTLLAEKHGLNIGDGRLLAAEVTPQPPVQNSTVSHHVTLTLTYELPLGEADQLIAP